MAPPRHPLRTFVLALFRHGDLVSIEEAVIITGVSRQSIHKWVKAEGINIEAHRLAYLAKRRTNAMRYLEDRPLTRKPTKAQMRRDLKDAIRRFNEANKPNQS